MKEIIRKEKECVFWKDNHCTSESKWLHFDKEHNCEDFCQKHDYEENINIELNNETESDLKGIAQKRD